MDKRRRARFIVPLQVDRLASARLKKRNGNPGVIGFPLACSWWPLGVF